MYLIRSITKQCRWKTLISHFLIYLKNIILKTLIKKTLIIKTLIIKKTLIKKTKQLISRLGLTVVEIVSVLVQQTSKHFEINKT